MKKKIKYLYIININKTKFRHYFIFLFIFFLQDKTHITTHHCILGLTLVVFLPKFISYLEQLFELNFLVWLRFVVIISNGER
jgi:hypothetical protein